MRYERQNIQRLTAYTPGEQPDGGTVTKLNTNENPYPPAAGVLEAIRGVAGEALRRYPPPAADAFRQVAAQTHGLSPDQVIATNGGDELLRLAVTVFCRPRAADNGRDETVAGGVAEAEPSYSLYPVLADLHDTPLIRVPLDDDFAMTDDFADRCLASACRLVMVVNPHAPSGRLESIETLRGIARSLAGRAVLLVDEAYVDFAEHDALPLVRDDGFDNVLILRTLSKGYSLAGLRFGYGLGHVDLIAALAKARDSYNTDALAQAAAAAALTCREEAARTWSAVIDERRRLTQALGDRGWRVWPSQANFVLAAPPAGVDAEAVYEALKSRAILVRYFDQDRLRDKLRITIGTPEQNDLLLGTLDELA